MTASRPKKMRAELSEERFRILEQSTDVILFDVDLAARKVSVSKNFEAQLGPSPDFDAFMTGAHVHSDDRTEYRKIFEEIENNETPQVHDLRLKTVDGQYRWFNAAAHGFMDKDGNLSHIIGKMVDVDARKRENEQLRMQAQIDSRTGLYNRMAAERLCTQMLDGADSGTFAMLIFDLDNLKGINDQFGHPQGDRAIKAFAAALSFHFGESGIVGRIGGDEFLVFLRGVASEAGLRSQVCSLVKRFSELRVGEEDNVLLTGSVGVALGTAPSDTFASLFRKADKALYHVKRRDKNGFALYNPRMDGGK